MYYDILTICTMIYITYSVHTMTYIQVMQQCGIEDEHVVLVLEDHQVVDITFLEIINSLLSAGEVPGLYTPEELEPLLTPLRDQASEAGFRYSVSSV